MKIIAIAPSGAEYMYDVFSAHAVPVTSAEIIRSALNAARYRLRPGYTWHLYDVGPYDNAFAIARGQRFYRRAGKLFDKEVYTY